MTTRTLHPCLLHALLVTVLLLCGGSAAASTGQIAFQGRVVTSAGAPVPDGIYAMSFGIYLTPEGGAAQWSETHPNVVVAEGFAAMALGGLSAFPSGLFETGADLWLEIALDIDGNGLDGGDVYTPRTPLNAVPVAFHANNAATLGGAPASAFVQAGSVYTRAEIDSQQAAQDTAIAGKADTVHTHGASAITSGVLGDARIPATIARTADVYTRAEIDSQQAAQDTAIAGKADTVHTHGAGAITSGTLDDARIPGNIARLDAVWRLGGNDVSSTEYLGTNTDFPLEFLANGLRALRIEPRAGSPNLIGGYEGNFTGAANTGVVIAGGGLEGGENRVTGNYSVVGGGQNNAALGVHSMVIGGGEGNTISAGRWATIAGGRDNETQADAATIGGGQLNVAGPRATVAGGYQNTASELYATVAGGYLNAASGSYATVAGGRNNIAGGVGSFAAGRRARPTHEGAFVLADYADANVASSADNQFTGRFTGGARFFTNSGLSTGVQLAAGGGSWSSVSDRNVKENVAPVDAAAVLEKVAGLEIGTWNYTSQNPAIRHMGPMAQDFHAAFGLGESERHIGTIDAQGVALAAIQGLHAENAKLRTEIAELRAGLQALEQAIANNR